LPFGSWPLANRGSGLPFLARRPRLAPLFFPEFLISGFAAVDDLGERLTGSLYVFVRPGTDVDAVDYDGLGGWELACGEILVEGSRTQSKPSCCFAGRKSFHNANIVRDRQEIVKGKV